MKEYLQEHGALKDTSIIKTSPTHGLLITHKSSIPGAPCLTCRVCDPGEDLLPAIVARAYLTSGKGAMKLVVMKKAPPTLEFLFTFYKS